MCVEKLREEKQLVLAWVAGLGRQEAFPSRCHISRAAKDPKKSGTSRSGVRAPLWGEGQSLAQARTGERTLLTKRVKGREIQDPSPDGPTGCGDAYPAGDRKPGSGKK